MNNALRLGHYTNNYRTYTTETVVIMRGKRILAKGTGRTFKAALRAARRGL